MGQTTLSPAAAPAGAPASPGQEPATPLWASIEEQAAYLISCGRGRDAFRLVLSCRMGLASEEAGEFLRRSFADTPLRFVMVMVQGIGNMVMMTPAVRALKQVFPRSEIEVVGAGPALDVVQGWPLVDTCTELEAYDTARERDAILLSMWSGRFQKIYAAHLLGGSAPVVQMEYKQQKEHESEFHLDMVRVLGFCGEKPAPYCRVEPVDWPFEADSPVALLSDTSNPEPDWQRKRWPHYGELARRFLSMGHQVGLIGGKAEAEAFDPDIWPDGVVNLLGRCSIPQTAYLIEKAGLLVANDSGPAHVAGAVGAETYVLFGPTMEAKNLPLGPRVHPITSDLGCRPCQYLPSWGECRRPRCMELITVGSVLHAMRSSEPFAAPEEGPPRVESASAANGEVRVDLGCGRFKRKGYIGVDVDPESAADVVCDVTAGIPLETDSVDYLAADNLLEHIGEGFVGVMNEIWRICKPGAKVEITVPLFPCEKAVSDPTHRRYFTEDSFSYLDARSARWQECGDAYGFKPFHVVARRSRAGELEIVLTPDKSGRSWHGAGGGDAPKPRLCFVTHNQPEAGGAENALHRVANLLVDDGFQVTVLYNEKPFIHRLPVRAPADARYDIEWVCGPDLPTFHRAAGETLARCADGIDICFSLWRATSPELISICKREGVVSGMWCQNVQYAPDRTNTSLFRLADFIVAVTPYMRVALEDRFSRSENVFVIPNAADDAFFEAYRERKDSRMNRFVFFGRLSDEQKGLVTLCEGLALFRQEHPDFTLDIVGDGPDADQMRSLVGLRELGENVCFLGWRGREELAALLPGYDLCVLPSNFEACSLAVIEAMAAGVPIITTAAGGTPLLIRDKKNGLLVPPRNPQALADAMKWACDHPAIMRLMARWAHKKALKRYHWERVVRDYRDVFAVVHAARAEQAGAP